MIAITQNKIAGFEPRWAPYPGFSLLFDNPGDSTSRIGDHLKIGCSSEPKGPLKLYFKLEDTINKLGRDLLIRTYLLCPLPGSSYHVTVWDGVNIDNVSSVHVAVRSDWVKFLQEIPHSLGTPPDSMAVVSKSELASRSFGSIGFQFKKLAIWGNQSLVAPLAAADETSEARLEDLSDTREELCEEAGKKLGVRPSRSYSPHITLGYFANEEHGQLARAHLKDWTERFRSNLEGSVITYESLDMYAFTDMASFFKLPSPKS
jgi:hypothetical protein